MKAFRIGRKPAGHWTNKTPPIRGGYQTPSTDSKNVSEKAPVECETLVDGGSPKKDGFLNPTSDNAPLLGDAQGTGHNRDTSTCSKRACSRSLPTPTNTEQDTDTKKEIPALGDVEKQAPPTRGRQPLTPEEYTEWAIQQGQVFDSQDFPALDPEIQDEITSKYMELHQRINEQGLYNCPYVQYGKEMVRYLSLFALFLVALRHEWYLTSACFLGLFWVSLFAVIILSCITFSSFTTTALFMNI